MEKQVAGHKMHNSGFKGTVVISFAVCCLVSAICLTLTLAYAGEQQAGKQKVVLTLDQCIKKALEASTEIGESRYEEAVYKAKKMQADSAVYPKVELLAITAPSPEAKREDFPKTEATDFNKKFNGIFGSADLTLIQPLYTFGKISGYREAASRGVKVAKAGVDKTTSDITLRIKELYYGLLLAKDMRNLTLEIKDELERSIEKTDKGLKAGSPWAEEINLYKFKAYLGEANRNLNEAEKGIALAKDALATSIGLPRGTEFDVSESSITPEDRMPDVLDISVRNAMELRPEITQLTEGLKARNALIDVEKSNYYPQFFLGATASVAGATNRERIRNPYILDYFNHTYGAVFVGLKWSIDFGITKGKVNEAEAEYYKLNEKKKFADEAIPFQVRKTYLDLDGAKNNIIETERAYTNAKKWLVSASANYDMGVGDARELTDAAGAYALTKANYLKSLYNQRLSYANLLYATGLDLREIK